MKTEKSKVFYVWLLMNLPLFFVLIVGFLSGVVQPFFHDVAYITHTIFALFVATLLYTGYVAAKISHNFKTIDYYLRGWIEKTQFLTNEDSKECIYLDIYARLRFPEFMVNFLIGLGFLGTIVGVIVGFQNAPADMFSDINQMQMFVKQVLVGFAVELHALFMGMITSLWLSMVVVVLEKYLDGFYMAVMLKRQTR